MFGKDITWREELVFGESFGMKKDMSPTKQTKRNQPKTQIQTHQRKPAKPTKN